VIAPTGAEIARRSGRAGGLARPVLIRLASAVPVVFGIVALTFALVRLLPGDPALLFSSGPTATEAEIQAIRVQLGLDRSIVEQLVIYVGRVFTGDLGYSILSGRKVSVDLLERLPASMELTLFALLLALAIALPLGSLGAVFRNSPIDQAARALAALGVSMPTFVTSVILVFIFFYLLGWAPDPVGRFDPFMLEPIKRITGFATIDAIATANWEGFWSALGKIMLPSMSMGFYAAGPLTRITRSSMISVLDGDYIKTARAMGLSLGKTYVVYALKNALLPILTTFGIVISYLLGANVLVEKIFAWPGIGSYVVDSLLASDYAPVQGFILLMGFFYVLVNLVIDLLYMAVDPRIRVQ